MTDYHIECFMGGYLISAKYTPTSQWLYMDQRGKWGTIERQADLFPDYKEAMEKMQELMKEEKPKYEARISKITVNKPGEALFSETATNIEIDDEGGGEYLKVSQTTGSVLITPEEWAVIRQQVDEMILNCREETKL